MSESGWVLTGELPADVAEKLETAMDHVCEEQDLFPPTLSRFEQPGQELWRVDIYFTDEPDPDFIAAIQARAGVSGWCYEVSPLEERDWVSESQKLLAPVRAGRFLVYGSHDTDKADPSLINLQLDAGQAFGTGKHETTAACLTLIDKLATGVEPETLLDIGTGSGVLALAACKLWPEMVATGTDIDPIAIEVAADNTTINDVPVRHIDQQHAGLALIVADGMQDERLLTEQPYDLVVANILAGPLIDMAADITAAVKQSGVLILSGLLITQAADVLAAYEEQGLKLVSKQESGEWAALQLSYA